MIGNRIKQRRSMLALTQEELGDSLGVSRNTIINWEKGKRKPDSEILPKISNVLDTSVAYLIGETDDARPPSHVMGEMVSMIRIRKDTVAGILNNKGITQTDFAGMIGFSPKHFSEIMNGKSGQTMKNFEKIANALGVKVGVILGEFDDPNASLFKLDSGAINTRIINQGASINEPSQAEECTAQGERGETNYNVGDDNLIPKRTNTDMRLVRLSNSRKTVEVELNVNDPPEFINLLLDKANSIVGEEVAVKDSSGIAFKRAVGGDTSN